MATGAGRPRRTSRFDSSASIVTCSLTNYTDELARALLNVGGPVDDHEELPCRWRYMPRKEWFQAGNKQRKE